MLSYVLRRAVWSVAIVLVVTLVTFLLLFVVSDPALTLAGPEATPKDVHNLRVALGLDKPVYVQYWRWMSDVLHGNFGESYRTNRPALQDIATHLPATGLLAGTAFLISLGFSIPLGVVGAVAPASPWDSLGRLVASIGQAVPLFWLGILLTIAFGVHLKWLPISGIGGVSHLILPSITLALYLIPPALRLTQAAMSATLRTDYIRTATAKGLPRVRVLVKHALRPAMVSVIGVLAIQLGTLLGGTVVIEAVFNWPGVGNLALRSITTGDIPVVQGIVVIMSVIFVALTALADVFVAYLDPRIRLE